MATQYYGTGRLDTVQKVAYTGTAGTSSAIGPQCRRVRILVTTDAYIKISKAGTAATTSDTYVPGLAVEYFTVTPGESVSAVQVASNGNLFVTEIV